MNPSPASAGRHIAGEEHSTGSIEEERSMSGGMTWSVECANAWHRYRAVPGQRLVNGNRFWCRHDRRRDPQEAAPWTKLRTRDRWYIVFMCHDPGAGPATQFGHVADMVWMPMRQQDRVHLADLASHLGHRSNHLLHPSREPRVDQYDAIVDDDRIGVDICDGNLNDPVDHFTHAAIFLAELSERGWAIGQPGSDKSAFKPGNGQQAPGGPAERPQHRRARWSA